MCPKPRSYDLRGPQPGVDDNLLVGSQPSGSLRRGSQPLGSASRRCLFHASTSRGHKSPDDAAVPEAPKAHEEVVVDAPLESYLGGPFDTSLLHLYVDQAVRHV